METPVELATTASKVVVKLNKTVLSALGAGIVIGAITGVGGKLAYEKIQERRVLVKDHEAFRAN